MVTASQLVDLGDLDENTLSLPKDLKQVFNARNEEVIDLISDDEAVKEEENEKPIPKLSKSRENAIADIEALFSEPLKDESGPTVDVEKEDSNGKGTSAHPIVLPDSPMDDPVVAEIEKMERRARKRKLPAFITDPKKKFSRHNPYSEDLRKKRKLDQAKKDDLCKKNLESAGRKALPSSRQRVIVFDTETTGFGQDDCVIEIGAVELIDGEITGFQFHSYVNAVRKSHKEAVKVHGLDTKFLARHRLIEPVMKSFQKFIDEDTILVAHNAAFDFRMLNQELKRLNLPLLTEDRIFDTQAYLRLRFPSRSYNLNAVCEYYHIDTSHRTIHGALLDAQLTAKLLQKLWSLEAHDIRAKNTNRFFMKKLS